MEKEGKKAAEFISMTEFARRLKVTPPAVYAAVKNGRLTTKTFKGKKLLEFNQARQDWVNNRRETSNKLSEAAAEASQRAQDGSLKLDPNHYAVSRALKEQLNAKILKLEYDTKLGKLVNSDEVRVELFNMSRTLRDSFLAIADRLAPRLAPKLTQTEVHSMITAEVVKILESFHETQRRLTSLS